MNSSLPVLSSGYIRCESKPVLASSSHTIWLISIERPSHKNALSVAMYRDLIQVLDSFSSEDNARVLVFTGGQGNFCSGNDLADFMTFSQGSLLDESSPVWIFMLALKKCPKPVVVAVEGAAVGIGATLLLHIDAVFASNNATFSFPFAKLGLCPEYASALLLPQRVGDLRARDWLMTGRPIAAAEAAASGLINRCCEDPLAEAFEHAELLAVMPANALVTTKSLINSAQVKAVDDMMTAEAEAFARALSSPEFAAAVSVFFARKS